MAVTFLEPGGDATFNASLTTAGGFWTDISSTPAVATDFVHGSHLRSIKYRTNSVDTVGQSAFGVINSSGTRISLYIYLNALPTGTVNFFADQGITWQIKLTSAGVLQFWNNSAQVGSNGSTLSTGVWYRLCLAFTVTSTTVNEFRLFKNGVLDISVTNATLQNRILNSFYIGNQNDATFDLRSSDHYIDNSSSLTDTGDIWVTAKRPNANGTTNGFTTQIGSGGSGYGTGHSPQVNERPLSTTNGWSMVGAGNAVTEEYSIEGKATGDIDISSATIVDFMGWAYMSSLAGETVQMIVGGVNSSQAITSTNAMYTKVAGSTTYPTGGTDIGITTDTSLTTVSLFECGVIVAYILIYFNDMLMMFR
jgi:hypothetical protein